MKNAVNFAKHLLFSILCLPTISSATNIAISAQQSDIEVPRFDGNESLTSYGYALSIGHTFTDNFSISASYQTDDVDDTNNNLRWRGEAEQDGYDLRLNYFWHEYYVSVGYQNHTSELFSQQLIELDNHTNNARFNYRESIDSDQFSFHASKDFDFTNSWLTIESGVIYSEQDASYREEIAAIRNSMPFAEVTDTQEESDSWLFNLSGFWSYPIVVNDFEAITSVGVSWYQVVTGDDVYLLESFQGRRGRPDANTITDRVIEPTPQDNIVNASFAFMWLVSDQLSIDASYQFDIDEPSSTSLINIGASWQF